MDHDDRGIIDSSSLRMREATMFAGVWLTYVLCGTGALYVAITWYRPHRLALAALFGLGMLAGIGISLLSRERVVRSRFREHFFLTWSVLDVILVSLLTLLNHCFSCPG